MCDIATCEIKILYISNIDIQLSPQFIHDTFLEKRIAKLRRVTLIPNIFTPNPEIAYKFMDVFMEIDYWIDDEDNYTSYVFINDIKTKKTTQLEYGTEGKCWTIINKCDPELMSLLNWSSHSTYFPSEEDEDEEDEDEDEEDEEAKVHPEPALKEKHPLSICRSRRDVYIEEDYVNPYVYVFGEPDEDGIIPVKRVLAEESH